MSIPIDAGFGRTVNNLLTDIKVKLPKPPVQNNEIKNPAANRQNFAGANNRFVLEKQLAKTASPTKALETIKQLPLPDKTDHAAVTEFKEQRATIADYAINNSTPPKREDYSSLPPRVAEMEYRDSSSYYNQQISELKAISDEAKANPNTIISPGEAVNQINELPRPDRNNSAEIKAYNEQRAAIADAALLYAEPPKREDYKGLPPQLANMEYQDALTAYNTNIRVLNEASNAKYSGNPPTITNVEANAAASEIINRYGGEGSISEGDGAAIGRDLAEIARQNPQDAAAIGDIILNRVEGTDRGDDIARGLAENLSVEELREISQEPAGKAFLEKARENLFDGRVNDKESSAAGKIDEAVTGLNPNSLTGNAETDAKTVSEQLENLPPELRDNYVQALLEHPYGQNAIRFAAVMSPEGGELLGQTLGELYQSNPTETAELLKQITDGDFYGSYPVQYQFGLAYVISKSGNDDLIETFAQNEINRAKNDPDEVRGYLNAVTAYAGLSPEALQNVMETNPDFFTAVEKAGFLTGGPPSSAGFENPNIWEVGLGSLLQRASQITDADGLATPEAIKLFEITVENVGANSASMEAAGAFFIEHAEQLVDLYTDPLNPDTPGSKVLEDFFGNVVYSPISDLLKFNGGSLVDAIMGDKNGSGGVLGGIIDKYLNQANAKAGDGEQDRLIGQRIGFLWSSLSEGFIQGVDNYKSKWNDDKEFRDFTFDMLGRGLGKIASKFGLPGEVVSKPLDFVQGIYDARAEKDKDKQLDAFVTAFGEINNQMFTRLNNFDADNENVEGLNAGFTSAYNWQGVQTMYSNLIKD